MLLDLQELRDYSLFEYYKQNKLQTYMKSDLRVRAVKEKTCRDQWHLKIMPELQA